MRNLPWMAAVAVLLAWVAGAGVAWGQTDPEVAPAELEGIVLTPRPGAQLPLELRFITSDGRSTTLGEALAGKPALLTFNYSSCPMLCSLQLDKLVEGLRALAGSERLDFRLVTISIDPSETAERAAAMRARYVEAYGVPEAGARWTFLRGDEASVRKLADLTGFAFRYIPARKEYAHPAAAIFVAPSGKVTSYIEGVTYEREELARALLGAQAEVVGGTTLGALMQCYFYEAGGKGHAAQALTAMRVGGAITVLVILVLLTVLAGRRGVRNATTTEGATA